MAIKISDVTILPTTVSVGETFTITITAVDVTWEVIKQDFENWEEISTEFTTWNSILNYH